MEEGNPDREGVAFRIEGLKHLADRIPVAMKQTVRCRRGENAGWKRALPALFAGIAGRGKEICDITSHEKETIVVRSYGRDVLSLRNSNWRWLCKKRSEC